MKIPLDWLTDYVDVKDKTPGEIAAAFTQLGLMLDKPLDATGVLDLEHRMDRSDWLSITGCARDLAAFYQLPLQLPKVKLPKLTRDNLVTISVSTPHVRRFKTRLIKGVKVQPSPKWLRERLEAYGIESKNNIVDVTNYVMVELGQTLHAQDLDRLKGRDITIRQAKHNEKLTTLLGTQVILDTDAFVLTSGGVATVLGGIVGGSETGVTDSTTDIILDSGNYDSKVIRQVSRRLKIFNESVSRNDKLLDPRAIDLALDRATSLILELAGGVPFENDDYYPNPVSVYTQILRFSRLALLSGMPVKPLVVKRILKSLGYQVVEESEEALTVEVPYFRTDIEVEDDLVADVLRIGDYANLPTLSLTTPIPVDLTPSILKFEDRLRDHLLSLGCHEHITSPLVEKGSDKNQVLLENSLSAEQNALRTSLIPALTRVVSSYHKHGQTQVIVFELGKVFSRPATEIRQLSVVGIDDVRPILTGLLALLGISDFAITSTHTITVSGKRVGQIDSAFAFSLDTLPLQSFELQYSGVISEFTHHSSLDLSLQLPKNMVFADVQSLLKKYAPGTIQLEVVDKFKSSILVRITFDHQVKNLDALRLKLLKALKGRGVANRSDQPLRQS